MSKKEKKETLRVGDEITLTSEEAQSLKVFTEDINAAKALANHAAELLSQSNHALFEQLERLKPDTRKYLINYNHETKIITIKSNL